MIYLIFIPLCLLFMPWLMTRYVCATEQSRQLSYAAALPYLVTAAVLWIASFIVPNIPLSAETTTFGQHATGGVAAAVLFWFATSAYQWQFRYWWQEPAALYFFVSGLGVANELFELLLTKAHIFSIESSDVWWDLLANTLGAAVALAGVWLCRLLIVAAQPRD